MPLRPGSPSTPKQATYTKAPCCTHETSALSRDNNRLGLGPGLGLLVTCKHGTGALSRASRIGLGLGARVGPRVGVSLHATRLGLGLGLTCTHETGARSCESATRARGSAVPGLGLDAAPPCRGAMPPARLVRVRVTGLGFGRGLGFNMPLAHRSALTTTATTTATTTTTTTTTTSSPERLSTSARLGVITR
eukprot:scaffold68107_cov48-Phaeocystis_antarctica.AAC.2